VPRIDSAPLFTVSPNALTESPVYRTRTRSASPSSVRSRHRKGKLPTPLASIPVPFAATLNAVSATLTTRVMREMNASVALQGQSPAVVADQFLRAHHLK